MLNSPAVEQGQEFERALMSKITRKLMPFLCICYIAAFIDRVNVGFAKEQMMADLGFSTAIYGLGAGIFFIGYFLFEVPSNIILERMGARVWIARIMVTWGIISTCMMFVSDVTSFYVLRFLLGAAEAGFFPGIIFYMTYWFPAAYRSRTVALFMTAAVVSNIIGSPLSGWLLEMDGVAGMRGWKWLFLIEGIPSMVLGILVFMVLPNKPADAKWLSSDERNWLETRIGTEQAQVAKHNHMSLVQALIDPRVLLLSFIYLTNVVGGYGLDFFQPTLVKQVFPDATPSMVGYINAIPALFAVFVMNWHGRSSDRRSERRWHFATAVWGAAGGLFLASLPLPPVVSLVALALAVSGRWSAIAPFWGLSTTFLSGRAAAGAIAMINSVGNLGGFAGPYIMGWFKDNTGDYILGLRILAVTTFIGGIVALTMRTQREPTVAGQESTA
jgi:ACS family tartrate transporter-like MFS transporter